MTEIRIRKALESDYEAICALCQEGDAVHQAALPDVFRPAGEPARSLEYIQQILQDPNALLLVAESNDAILGLLQACVRSAPDIPILHPRRSAFVDTLVVSEHFRRQGIARALMYHVEEWATKLAIPVIELNVWEFNESAIRLYEELGYTTASRRMWRSLK
jgi:ribosomal protein S18 acetylase RimI-like enzyme